MQYCDRIRLDRYARKSSDQQLRQGDLVVASIERTFDREARKVESREIGTVTKVHPDQHYDVRIDNDNKETIIRIPRHRLEYIIEKTYAEICRRVADAVAAEDPKGKEFADTVYDLMVNEKFIAAGRILAGLGRPDYTLTLFNCYVFNPQGDSRAAITAHWGRLFETYSRGGGVGTPLSVLRPRGAIVRKVNGRSSGSVSWAEQFSQITGAVEQGGSRRGAAMICQWCWHPDILEFIQVKALREEFKTPSGEVVSRNRNLLKNANISVMLTNDFMKLVEQDGDWDLVFPDLDDPDYDELWDGDLWRWRDQLNKPVVVYQTIKARELWNQIIQRAWESGEPGILFMERCNDLSNSYYYAPLVGTNPCAEQVLTDSAVCNLGHLNLSKFVLQDDQFPEQERTATVAAKQVDWDGLAAACRTGVRFLDNVNDLNQHHDKLVEQQQNKERRVGLGLLGYGEMLLRLGLRYGSDEALKFTDRLMKHFASQSYLASIDLAAERGPFPAFDAELFPKSGFMKRHAKAVRDRLEEAGGIRNVTVNTVAPTGSVASLLRTSSGCEPFFELEYTSTTRIGIVTERPPVGDEIANKFGTDRKQWPDYVVTAQKGITPEQHVRTQAAMQRWIDSSLSKTVNVPNSATPEDISTAYRLMWELGCKGGTVYRDGSRDEQVLYLNEPEPEEVEVEVVEGRDDLGVILERPDVGYSVTFSEESPVGNLHATLRHDSRSGEPRDIFLLASRGDVSADTEAIGRLISVILRWPNNRHVNQHTRLEIIRDQLMGILGRGQVGFGPNTKHSLPDTIAKIIDRYLSADFPMSNIPFGFEQMRDLLDELREVSGDRTAFDKIASYVLYGDTNGDAEEATDQYQEELERTAKQAEADGVKLPYDYCPDCGNHTLVTIPGKCPYCRNCGYSRC